MNNSVNLTEHTYNVRFYIAQYPVRWTAQNGLHFTPLAELFIPTPTRLLWEEISHAAITLEDYLLKFRYDLYPGRGDRG